MTGIPLAKKLLPGGRKKVWRQGDVYIIGTPGSGSPGGTAKAAGTEVPPILARGEVTGHSHRVEDPATARLFRAGSGEDMTLSVTAATATIVHEEHQPVCIPRGEYVVRIQREYTPERIVRVAD
ncbi:hypothetical protein DB346_02045 [Verrucomicrobia bacterium LW23]|nr:hypothetical protein DB346_02045 [Verrucomicrobia bacterium LW23]